MSNSSTGFWLALAGLFVGGGVAAAGYFGSQTMLQGRIGANTATVKGLSERKVQADRAVWNIQFVEKGTKRDDIPEMYARMRTTEKRILETVSTHFEQEDISTDVFNLSEYEHRNREGIVFETEYTLGGAIIVDTTKVAEIEASRRAVGELVAEGVPLSNEAPRFLFAGLNTIKPDMLREATANARVAATEFASNAGIQVGAIRSARQGGFTVRDANEERSESRKIEKDIRVVTTIEFYLTE